MRTIRNERQQKNATRKTVIASLRQRLLEPLSEHEFGEVALLAYRNSTTQVREAALLALSVSKFTAPK